MRQCFCFCGRKFQLSPQIGREWQHIVCAREQNMVLPANNSFQSPITREGFRTIIKEKVSNPIFRNDTQDLLKSDIKYDIEDAASLIDGRLLSCLLRRRGRSPASRHTQAFAFCRSLFRPTHFVPTRFSLSIYRPCIVYFAEEVSQSSGELGRCVHRTLTHHLIQAIALNNAGRLSNRQN